MNLAGREEHGIVSLNERPALIEEIARKLKDFRDPANGHTVVEDITPIENPFSKFAPDLIVGYAPPYRGSWKTALGDTALGETSTGEMIRDNDDPWIADHCLAARAVPGVLIGNRKPRVTDPQLKDLTVTVLHEFGVAPDPEMRGRPLY